MNNLSHYSVNDSAPMRYEHDSSFRRPDMQNVHVNSECSHDRNECSHDKKIPLEGVSDTKPAAEVDLAITGMTCAACVARVEKKLNKWQGVTAVVNLATEKAHVRLTSDAAQMSNEELIDIVHKAGYGAYCVNRVDILSDGTRISHVQAEAAQAAENAAGAAKNRRVQDLWRRFLVSAALSVPVVSISMIPALQFCLWQWIAGVLALIVSIYCAWPFHRAAFRAARHGSSTMDTLVSLGVIASMGWSIWAVTLGGAGGADYRMAMSGVHKIAGAMSSAGSSAASAQTVDASHIVNAEYSAGAGMAHVPHVYFESSAMIVTFLLLGRWLEARSRRSAGDALQELLHLGADCAYLVTKADGSAPASPVISASDLQVGDIFRVKPGEKVPADGVIVNGSSAINASLVTGESAPVEVGAGDTVTGATINTYGTLDVCAVRVGEETTLAHMGRLLTQAQSGKAPVQRLADKISSLFVPSVLGIAVVNMAARLIAAEISGGSDKVIATIESALTSAMTVLVVACPCALGLAIPTALLVGSGAASKLGIFMRGPEILEQAHHVNVALLDKTGTLTAGAMRVVGVVTAEESRQRAGESDYKGADADADADAAEWTGAQKEVLRLAAVVEEFSEHPIARAIIEEAGNCKQICTDELWEISDESGFRALPGRGAEAAVKGLGSVLVGKESWLRESGFDIPYHVREAAEHFSRSGATVVAVGAEKLVVAETPVSMQAGESKEKEKIFCKRFLGSIAVSDAIRAEAPAAIAQIKQLEIEPIIMSGDHQEAADAVAAQLGIKARGGILPEEKVTIVRSFQKNGTKVLMAGDGVNDAAALAAADLSVAVGAGTDVAKAAADMTIMTSDLRLIPAAIRISKRTLRIIKQNLAWAFGYNLIAIPLALAGFIAPGLAAAAMASSSVIVVCNSLRLRNVC